jgi:hypothetical protein
VYEYDTDDPFVSPSNNIPVTLDKKYLDFYSQYSVEYQELFAYYHQRLNNLFDFMNQKIRTNHHYNAQQSRYLIDLIKDINSLKKSLKSEGIIINIDTKYESIFKICSKFLEYSQGSKIPDDLEEIDIIQYDPIFSIDNITKQGVATIKQLFNNPYMNRLIDDMIEAVEKNPADAIGKSKEFVESCCKTILSEMGVENIDKLNMGQLIKKVKDKLELKSKYEEVNQIIGGLSSILSGIAELRNAKGSGHGRNALKFKDPSKIEARLAVDAASALVRFYWTLHKQKQSNDKTKGTK